ncbi:hypothetical protein RKLH11_4288 [Rhodobacteraceae bacterium KLH11]|nr:hypothetical protein RKLH11_4288 [Rhodobacteraceae bacterium KLH11]
MRFFRLQYPALATVLVFACFGTTLSAEQATQEDDLSRIVGHFGKVMKLPTEERVVLYAPLDEVWRVFEDGRITERGSVQTKPRPDWRLELHWRSGDIDVLDASNADQLVFLDQTPPFIPRLEQIIGNRLVGPVGSLPEGAQLAEGGTVFAGANAGEVIGHWQILPPGVEVFALDGAYSYIVLTDLIVLPTQNEDK